MAGWLREYSLSIKNCSVIMSFCCRHLPRMARVGEWLSLVEHLVRDQGVGGSNPLSPTIYFQRFTFSGDNQKPIHLVLAQVL